MDAETESILSMYLVIFKSLKYLELDMLSESILNPIKVYLETRPDAVRKIIFMILDHLEDNDIQALLRIFASRDLFAKEYKLILAEQLSNLTTFQVDEQIRNVELMSSLFEESQMISAQIMMKDVADSRRIANHFSQKTSSVIL